MKKLFLSLVAITLVAGPSLALAAGPSVTTADDVLTILNNLTNWLYTIFLIVAVIFIILAAFKYLTSGGGEEVGVAHKMLLYAAIAIAVAMLSKGIVRIVEILTTP